MNLPSTFIIFALSLIAREWPIGRVNAASLKHGAAAQVNQDKKFLGSFSGGVGNNPFFDYKQFDLDSTSSRRLGAPCRISFNRNKAEENVFLKANPSENFRPIHLRSKEDESSYHPMEAPANESFSRYQTAISAETTILANPWQSHENKGELLTIN